MSWCVVLVQNGSKECSTVSGLSGRRIGYSFKHVYPPSRGSTKRVEGNNYDTRKQSPLQHDDVMRGTTGIIYAERYDVITANRDLVPKSWLWLNGPSNGLSEGATPQQEERIEAILNFAKYNLVPKIRFWKWYWRKNQTRKSSTTCMDGQKKSPVEGRTKT